MRPACNCADRSVGNFLHAQILALSAAVVVPATPPLSFPRSRGISCIRFGPTQLAAHPSNWTATATGMPSCRAFCALRRGYLEKQIVELRKRISKAEAPPKKKKGAPAADGPPAKVLFVSLALSLRLLPTRLGLLVAHSLCEGAESVKGQTGACRREKSCAFEQGCVRHSHTQAACPMASDGKYAGHVLIRSHI